MSDLSFKHPAMHYIQSSSEPDLDLDMSALSLPSDGVIRNRKQFSQTTFFGLDTMHPSHIALPAHSYTTLPIVWRPLMSIVRTAVGGDKRGFQVVPVLPPDICSMANHFAT